MSNKDTGSKQAATNRGSSTATAGDDVSTNGVVDDASADQASADQARSDRVSADQSGKAQGGSGKAAKTRADNTPPPPPPPDTSDDTTAATTEVDPGETDEADSGKSEAGEAEVDGSEVDGSGAGDTGAGETEAKSATRSTPTAGDYAHTFSNSPDSTAVIPVVRDNETKSAEVAKAPSGRRASLKIAHVDPWSVTKIAFALSVALMIVAVIAVSILWVVLAVAGVWDQINSSVSTVLSDGSSRFEIQDYLGFGRIIGLTLILSAINVVIITAITAIGTRLYNLGADLLGGIDVTFSED